MSHTRMLLSCGILLAVLLGCSDEQPGRAPAPGDAAALAPPVGPPVPAVTPVDGARIAAADSEPHNWLSHGRSYAEQRFSPLDRIDTANVGRLGLAWSFDFPTDRGMEATPIVVDGRLYVTSTWSMVYAFDAKTGALLWQHDPEVPRQWAVHLCCDAVNRGVAAWGGKVFVGTLDGRLLALDANDGKLLWSVQTTPVDKPYSITGAPRVVKGQVIIGNGGSELGVRGYVSAYDAETGEHEMALLHRAGRSGAAL